MWNGHFGSIKTVQHRFELNEKDNRPIFPAPYHASWKVREFEKQEIIRILAMDSIEPVQAEQASPIVFVLKNRTHYFCVEYRKLNTVTIHGSYQIPCMPKCIGKTGDGTTFSTLDGNRWFLVGQFAEEDRNKTAFTFHHGVSIFLAYCLDWRMRKGCFQERWTSYGRNSSTNLPLSI